MPQDFDLVVIGTGAAGSTAALKCSEAGWRVAIIDELPFGGTCGLRGCDPKKVLVGAAELVDWARRMHPFGVVTQRLELDWPALIRFKRTFTDPVPHEREDQLSDSGIVLLHGHAEFVDASTLSIGDRIVRARHVLIASGAVPMRLDVPGENLLTTSDAFMELDTLPSPIVFVGGGFISFEFAHIAARAGAQTHIIDSHPRPLGGFDPDLVDRLVEATRELGIQLHFETEVTGLERRGENIVVRGQRGDRDVEVTGAIAVHGGGRVANIDRLRLEAAGVERTQKGVKVNQYLQSASNPAVYAAGDAADGGGLQLTPVAGAEGEIAAENLLNGNRRAVDFTGITGVVYTIPALSSSGLTEEQARERGLRFTVKASDTSDWYSSRRIASKPSAYKMLIDEDEQVIIGAHVLDAHAEDLANIFALAIRARIPLAVLRETLFGYPTAASDIEYMI